MEFLSKEATGFECNVASLSSPATEWQTVHQFSLIILLQAFKHSISRSSIQWQLSQFCSLDQYAESESKPTLTLQRTDIQVWKTDYRHACFHRQLAQQNAKELLLLMVDDFHVAILLNPKLSDDDIVHATCGVCPGVRLIVSMEKNA